ncbi:Unknown protein, partial [Striga hermonthica]
VEIRIWEWIIIKVETRDRQIEDPTGHLASKKIRWASFIDHRLFLVKWSLAVSLLDQIN